MKDVKVKIPCPQHFGMYLEYDLRDIILEIGYDKEIRMSEFIELLVNLLENAEKSKN